MRISLTHPLRLNRAQNLLLSRKPRNRNQRNQATHLKITRIIHQTQTLAPNPGYLIAINVIEEIFPLKNNQTLHKLIALKDL